VYDATAKWSADADEQTPRLESRVGSMRLTPPPCRRGERRVGGRRSARVSCRDVHDQAHEGHGDIHDAARPRPDPRATHTQAERQAALDLALKIKERWAT